MRLLRKACKAYGILGKGLLMKRLFKSAAALLVSICVAVMPFSGINAGAAVSCIWPLDDDYQRITCYFDPNRNNGGSGHNAIDIEADADANIYAVYGGVCVSAEWMGDYGNLIILHHEGLGIYTFYAHCNSMYVSAGQAVNAGEVIGGVGATGVASGNHLHFGVCDNLLGGYPDVTYYDPLTYFSFDGESAGGSGECGCSEEYAGIYTTTGVTTYLNIRSGHGSEYSVVGQIQPGEEFTVTKADSQWAHVVCNGVSGFCSMEFIKRVGEINSSVTISGETCPTGSIALGSSFSVKGKISSALPLVLVTAGIYSSDGSKTYYESTAEPGTLTFDLSKFDNDMLFNKLTDGNYLYYVKAADSSGSTYDLIKGEFQVGSPQQTAGNGDLNGDGRFSIADAVILQGYLLGDVKLTSEQMAAADMTGDGRTDAYDMAAMRKALIS